MQETIISNIMENSADETTASELLEAIGDGPLNELLEATGAESGLTSTIPNAGVEGFVDATGEVIKDTAPIALTVFFIWLAYKYYKNNKKGSAIKQPH